MKKFLVSRTREDGFTLIELLVVVIIIAILAAVAVPVYIGLQNNAKKSSIQSDVATTKLNVAAVLTEDGNVVSGTYATAGKAGDADVQVSKSVSDETIKVTVNADKSFTVTGHSDNLGGRGYTVSYDSTSAQNTVTVGELPPADTDPIAKPAASDLLPGSKVFYSKTVPSNQVLTSTDHGGSLDTSTWTLDSNASSSILKVSNWYKNWIAVPANAALQVGSSAWANKISADSTADMASLVTQPAYASYGSAQYGTGPSNVVYWGIRDQSMGGYVQVFIDPTDYTKFSTLLYTDQNYMNSYSKATYNGSPQARGTFTEGMVLSSTDMIPSAPKLIVRWLDFRDYSTWYTVG